MTPEQIEIERKAFEANFKLPLNRDHLLSRDLNGDYIATSTYYAWDGWLARAEQSQWRPIAEAPKDGPCVLLFSFDGGCQQGRWGSFWNEWLSSDDGRVIWDPTHYMPLPAPPVE